MSAAGRVAEHLLAQRLARTAGRWPRSIFGAVDENAARLARAEEMGFDTSRIYYHGTKADFPAFQPSRNSPAFQPSRNSSDSFVGLLDGGAGKRQRATYGPGVYVSRTPDRANDFAGVWDETPEGGNVIPVFIRRGKFKRTINNEGRVERPEDVRSVFARFDPAKAGSAELLAGLSVGLPISAVTLREALRQRAEQT